jgi:hypothetical protein
MPKWQILLYYVAIIMLEYKFLSFPTRVYFIITFMLDTIIAAASLSNKNKILVPGNLKVFNNLVLHCTQYRTKCYNKSFRIILLLVHIHVF